MWCFCRRPTWTVIPRNVWEKGWRWTSDGRKGGLLLLWKHEIRIQRLDLDRMYIVDDGNNNLWRLIGIYDEFQWENKYKTWDHMHQLIILSHGCWLGISMRYNFCMKRREETPDPNRPLMTELRDLGYRGDRFTWQRGRIRERLDRGLLTKPGQQCILMRRWRTWGITTPTTGRYWLIHKFLCTWTERWVHVKRFEARWLREKAFNEKVQEAWNEAGSDPTANNIHEKLDRMHRAFHAWDQRVLKKPKNRLRKAQKELAAPISDDSEEKRKELSELVEYYWN